MASQTPAPVSGFACPPKFEPIEISCKRADYAFGSIRPTGCLIKRWLEAGVLESGNDPGIGVVLDPVDQLHGLRRTLLQLRYAIGDVAP
jgi:hypothetical protein